MLYLPANVVEAREVVIQERNPDMWGPRGSTALHVSRTLVLLDLTEGIGGKMRGNGGDEDIFSGVVSTELGPSLETQRHRGRQDYMDKPLLFSIALMIFI